MSKQDFCFIPSPVFQQMMKGPLKDILGSFESVETKMSIDRFNMPGHVISATPDIIANLKEVGDLEEEMVHTPVGDWPVLTDGMSAVSSDVKPANLFEGHESVVEEILITLSDLGHWTGLEVRLFFVPGPCFQPRQASYREINIVVGAAPPGEWTTVQGTHLCGVMLNPRGRMVSRRGPTTGNGLVVNDEEGRPVAQIVGRTIYLLLPLHGFATIHTLNGEGGGLFTHALRLAWNTFVEPLPESEERKIADAKALEMLIAVFIEKWPLSLVQEIYDLDQEILGALAHYRELLNEKRQKQALLTAGASLMKSAGQEVEKRWDRILAMPAFDSISFVEHGIHIRTKPLTSEEWEGMQRTYGVFIVRFGANGRVSVWAEKSFHPRGVPHPHISAEGVACFGNVGPIIEAAASELRYDDAFEIIVSWLVGGYDPELALVKITEWPVAAKEVA